MEIKPFLVLFLSFFSICVVSTYAAVPKGNGVWVYDAVFDEQGNRIGLKPGLFSTGIKTYNSLAQKDHKLTQLYSHGGSIKMFCHGSGGTSNNVPCTLNTIHVQYYNEITQAYNQVINVPTKSVSIIPVIDGVPGNPDLKHFNTMTRETAWLVADAVAKAFCADPTIDGVQFDIEPFDITHPGQAFFYAQIAKNFAGKHFANKADPYGCVDAKHPHGRIFSVFATARKINDVIADILNRYGNGYFIGALYTLGPVTDKSNPPDVYEQHAVNEVKRMVKQAWIYNVKYQFGIPASATMEEFETRDRVSSSYQQLMYVKLAIAAINAHARTDTNYLGINLWAYSSRRMRRGLEYTPSGPPANVLTYLYSHL